jgi:hypothetical protein
VNCLDGEVAAPRRAVNEPALQITYNPQTTCRQGKVPSRGFSFDDRMSRSTTGIRRSSAKRSDLVRSRLGRLRHVCPAGEAPARRAAFGETAVIRLSRGQSM